MERFNQILCVVTTLESSKFALDRAVTLVENNQARLTAVVVTRPISIDMGMPDGGPISTDLQTAAVKACEQRLEMSVAPYLSRVEMERKVLVGIQFLEIIRKVLRDRHDLVIKACEPLEWLDRLFGSEDMHLLRKCPCPVWLIKSSAREKNRRILAAVDVNLAAQIEADLVVMGTVARVGVPGFIMGNTAESILNQLDCSVLAIKPTDFVTPIGSGDHKLVEIKP